MKRLKKVLLFILSGIIIFILLLLIAFNISPRPGAMVIGHLFNAPVEMTDKTAFKEDARKITVNKDLNYSSKFQKHTYDLYRPKNTTKKVPVMIWVHGGGYVGGDKLGVKEFATKIAANSQVAVIAMNYQEAPASKYPNQVTQVAELITTLQKEKPKNLDLQQLFFGGDSAGAQIALQYVALQTNKKYANQMDFARQLEPKTIKGVLSYCGPVNLIQMKAQHSDSAFMKFFVHTVAWSLIGSKNWQDSAELKQASIVHAVTPDFPPTYITDGNTASFDIQGKALQNRLQKMNIPVTGLFFATSKKINHEYQFDYTTKEAQLCYQQTLTFLNQYLTK